MRLTEFANHAGWGVRNMSSRRAGVVVSYAQAEDDDPRKHESVARELVARRLAALQGYEYAGEYRGLGRRSGHLYFVPCSTLQLEDAQALGIRGEHDLFGGVVPFPFVATKTITHPLTHPDAAAPAGWSSEFARSVKDAVLTGYAAFSREDAKRGAERLLATGPVRLKPALALGGRGQVLASDAATLASAIDELDPEELAECGVIVEQNLAGATTYSVGQIQVADLVATYVGTQKTVRDHHGIEVYGGSSLRVARGDFDALLALDLEDGAHRAIERACIYDTAARRCFAGFFASRRNYDIVHGIDAGGVVRTGVLEQSWRIGGATGAEIAALEAFREDPALDAVSAECTESYDQSVTPPSGATVYFRGIDPYVGFIAKYTTVAAHGDA
jgi:hypothetical protein